MSVASLFFTPSPSFSSSLPITIPKLTTTTFPLRLHLSTTTLRHRQPPPFLTFSTLPGGDGGNVINNNNSGGGGGNNDDGKGKGGGGNENAGDKNKNETFIILADAGRSMESLPKDLAAAIQAGRIPGSAVERFLGLEKSGFMRWLMQFGGLKERLLADDLFLAKVGMECGVGIFTKVMAIIADFMLVFLPAPTVSLRPPLAVSAGAISKFFYSCPDDAFQVALPGISYSLLQRFGAVMRNGAKLFAVGTTSSLVGTAVTNVVINAKKAVDKNSAAEVENIPILSTSVAYGVYMAVSSNLRYQVLAGVIEQRLLEPLLHKHKLMLSAICFAVRTGNTFLGSLLWVDYARLVGIQKANEEVTTVLE